MLGAAAFGVILGIFAALWAAGIRRRLSRVTEVKERIGATVLGEIPRTGTVGLRPAELFVKHTEPMAMEAFQELRSNLLISLPPGASAAIAVTSCDPGEGKTSVATNIAWALAAQDRHVTAIDCDLRKPALHTYMGVPFGPGVTSRRTEDALAHASRTPNPYLDVIPAGIIDRHPSDVVSAHLPLLLEELRDRHDTALVDCPPLIGVAETVLIAAMVDLSSWWWTPDASTLSACSSACCDSTAPTPTWRWCSTGCASTAAGATAPTATATSGAPTRRRACRLHRWPPP